MSELDVQQDVQPEEVVVDEEPPQVEDDLQNRRRQQQLAALERGRKTALENRRKKAAQRKQEQAAVFVEQGAKAKASSEMDDLKSEIQRLKEERARGLKEAEVLRLKEELQSLRVDTPMPAQPKVEVKPKPEPKLEPVAEVAQPQEVIYSTYHSVPW